MASWCATHRHIESGRSCDLVAEPVVRKAFPVGELSLVLGPAQSWQPTRSVGNWFGIRCPKVAHIARTIPGLMALVVRSLALWRKYSTPRMFSRGQCLYCLCFHVIYLWPLTYIRLTPEAPRETVDPQPFYRPREMDTDPFGGRLQGRVTVCIKC